MDLSIIIVSYNTKELTLACLASIYEQTGSIAFEVIVIDNGSTDGSADAIGRQFPGVTLLQPGGNLGFAGANNLGAGRATGEYLLLLNPDTVVLDRAIERLYQFARAHPEAGIFGGRTLFADGSLNPASCLRRPSLWNVFCTSTGLSSMFPRSSLFATESYGPWKRNSVRHVDIVSGCCFLIPRKLWTELNGFDPAFFMYGEETDLCMRAAKRNVRCLICPEARIIHYGGASEKVRADKMVRLFNAKAKLFRRHWRAVQARLGIIALDFWALSRVGAFAILSRLRNDRRESFQTWLNIWQRRREWHLDV